MNVLQQLSRQVEMQRLDSNGRSGPRVEFSVPPALTGPIGTLQEEALKWMREMGNNNLPPQAQTSIEQLEETYSTALATLLARLRKTAEYTQSRDSTVIRIQKILNTLFANPELLSSFGTMALECTETCDDRTALGLLYMELALLEHQLTREIKSSSKASALNSIKHTGLGVFKQKHLMKIAHEHAKQVKGFVDETEIVLKFLTNLGKKLKLPAHLDHMLYASFAWQVESADLEKAEQQITEQANLDHPAFLDFLATWHPMQEALQRHFLGLWQDLAQQCNNIDTAMQKALEQQNTAYETACEQHGEESPQALDWKARINHTNETRQTKRAAVWRAAIQQALNTPAEDDQAGPSKKPRLNRPD